MATNGLGAADAEDQTGQSSSATVTVTDQRGGGGAGVRGFRPERHRHQLHRADRWGRPSNAQGPDSGWGFPIEEGSEALASQLGLAPGAGLVVTYVAPDSPAAKAGLEKNDVLVELEGQLLVHPAQLRKLVQARKEGDTIELVVLPRRQETDRFRHVGQGPRRIQPAGGRPVLERRRAGILGLVRPLTLSATAQGAPRLLGTCED